MCCIWALCIHVRYCATVLCVRASHTHTHTAVSQHTTHSSAYAQRCCSWWLTIWHATPAVLLLQWEDQHHDYNVSNHTRACCSLVSSCT